MTFSRSSRIGSRESSRPKSGQKRLTTHWPDRQPHERAKCSAFLLLSCPGQTTWMVACRLRADGTRRLLGILVSSQSRRRFAPLHMRCVPDRARSNRERRNFSGAERRRRGRNFADRRSACRSSSQIRSSFPGSRRLQGRRPDRRPLGTRLRPTVTDFARARKYISDCLIFRRAKNGAINGARPNKRLNAPTLP